MFTGIVQGLGKIVSLEHKASELRLTILPQFDMRQLVDGESIAVDGVCLSVEKHEVSTFSAYASRQTMDHTNFGQLKIGTLVNLERALAFGERLGGHLVSGHVDCVALVKSIEKINESRKVLVTFPPSFSDMVIDRGSITLDGISLTVTGCGKGFLTVNIIPESQKRTNMIFWKPGTELNMETDLVGKYVVNYARVWFEKRKPDPNMSTVSNISEEFLYKHGFL